MTDIVIRCGPRLALALALLWLCGSTTRAGKHAVIVEDRLDCPARVAAASAADKRKPGSPIVVRATASNRSQAPIRTVKLLVAAHDASHTALVRRVLVYTPRTPLEHLQEGAARGQLPGPQQPADHVTVSVHRVEFADGSVWEPPGEDPEWTAALRRGAEEGDPYALHGLGLAYYEGRGLARDDVFAYVWLHLAAARGHETAAATRDHVARSMKPEDIEWARNHAGWLAVEFLGVAP